MKYEVLGAFRTYLNQEIKNKNTASRYYFAVEKLFRDKEVQFDSLAEVSPSYLESQLLRQKTKNDFSATKNGLKYLAQFSPELKLPSEEFFKEVSLKKRNWNQRPP